LTALGDLQHDGSPCCFRLTVVSTNRKLRRREASEVGPGAEARRLHATLLSRWLSRTRVSFIVRSPAMARLMVMADTPSSFAAFTFPCFPISALTSARTSTPSGLFNRRLFFCCSLRVAHRT